MGIAINYRSFQPRRPWLPLDEIPTRLLSHLVNDAFPRCLTTGKLDYLVRRIRLAHCAPGPERCEQCRALDREVPALRFVHDGSIERGARVEEILKRIERGEPAPDEEDGEA